MGMLYEYDEPEPATAPVRPEQDSRPALDPSKWVMSITNDGDLTAYRGCDTFILTSPDDEGMMEFGTEEGDMWTPRYCEIHFDALAAFVDYHRSKKAGS